MKIVMLGDCHLIADADPYTNLHRIRAFFKNAWPSVRRLLRRINEESPDLTVMLGDLVDWFSPENTAFGLELLSTLRSPWHMIPGNHDIQKPSGGFDQDRFEMDADRARLAYWQSLGVDLSTRVVDLGSRRLVLLDNSLSDVTAGTAEILQTWLSEEKPSLLCAHVPCDLPFIREYILSIDAARNLKKYVQSGTPDLYRDVLKARVTDIFTAHLHFPGLLEDESTRFHLCGLSTSIHDPYRNQTAVAEALVVEQSNGALTRRVVTED